MSKHRTRWLMCFFVSVTLLPAVRASATGGAEVEGASPPSAQQPQQPPPAPDDQAQQQPTELPTYEETVIG